MCFFIFTVFMNAIAQIYIYIYVPLNTVSNDHFISIFQAIEWNLIIFRFFKVYKHFCRRC